MSRRVELAGQRFGNLTVKRFAGIKRKFATWTCVCDCGKEITAIGSDLITGRRKTLHCGCMTVSPSGEDAPGFKGPNKAFHSSDGTTAITLERRNGEIYLCYIDTADYDKIKSLRWHYTKSKKGRTAYVIATPVRGENHIAMHNVLMPDAPDAPDEVDHEDHDGLNNRRSNLRAATRSQNMANTRRFKPKSSRYRGVTWVAKKRKYQAAIKVDDKWKFLGLFADEEHAARAYNAVAREQFGEFATLNELPFEAIAA
jgi:hypothetical protein